MLPLKRKIACSSAVRAKKVKVVEMKLSFDTLPNEVLFCIFKFLTVTNLFVLREQCLQKRREKNCGYFNFLFHIVDLALFHRTKCGFHLFDLPADILEKTILSKLQEGDKLNLMKATVWFKDTIEKSLTTFYDVLHRIWELTNDFSFVAIGNSFVSHLTGYSKSYKYINVFLTYDGHSLITAMFLRDLVMKFPDYRLSEAGPNWHSQQDGHVIAWFGEIYHVTIFGYKVNFVVFNYEAAFIDELEAMVYSRETRFYENVRKQLFPAALGLTRFNFSLLATLSGLFPSIYDRFFMLRLPDYEETGHLKNRFKFCGAPPYTELSSYHPNSERQEQFVRRKKAQFYEDKINQLKKQHQTSPPASNFHAYFSLYYLYYYNLVRFDTELLD